MSIHPHFAEIRFRATQCLKELQPAPRKARSKHANWNAVSLIERFQTLRYNTREAREKILCIDAEHFSSEFSLQSPIKQFEYVISRKTNLAESGGYTEPFAVLLSNFVQLLANEGRLPNRSCIEQLTIQRTFDAFQKLVNQAEQTNQFDHLTTQGILITSPPDTKSAGYAGIDSLHNWAAPEHNQTFCYLMQVDNYTEDEIAITVKQYLLWPNMQQLLDLHKLLNKPLQPSSTNVTCELYANAIPISLSGLKKLAPPLDLAPPDPSEDSLQQVVRQILYQNADQHTHSFRERPQVDESAFWHYHNDLFHNFYLRLAHPLFDQAVELHHANATNTKEYQATIDELDQLFTWFKTAEASWIKTHNTNPLFQQKYRLKTVASLQHALNRIVQSCNEILHGKGEQTNPSQLLSVTNITNAYTIHLALRNSHHTSTSDLVGLNQTLSMLGGVSGKIQCGTGATLKIPLQLFRQIATFEHLSGSSLAFGAIPLAERKQLHTQIQKLEYVELNLPGANQIYMVPKSYLEGRGCEVDPATGRVWGPCGPDGARIYLDDPVDTMAYTMTQSEFVAFKTKLVESITSEEVRVVSDVITNQTDEKLHPELKKTLAILHKHLFKHVLSVIEWLAGDYLQELHENLMWLEALKIKLQFAANPFLTLQLEIIQILEKTPELLAKLGTLQNPLPHAMPKAV